MGFEPGDSNHDSVLHSFPSRHLDKTSSKNVHLASPPLFTMQLNDDISSWLTAPIPPIDADAAKTDADADAAAFNQVAEKSRPRTKTGTARVRERATTNQAGRRTIESQAQFLKTMKKKLFQFRSRETFYTSAACLKNSSCLVRYVKANHHQLLKHDRIIRPLF